MGKYNITEVGSILKQKALRAFEKNAEEHSDSYLQIMDAYNNSDVAKGVYPVAGTSELKSKIKDFEDKTRSMYSAIEVLKNDLNKDFIDSFNGINSQISAINNNITNYDKFFSQFNNNEEFLDWSYGNKYKGKTVTEIDDVINNFSADGAASEKRWLMKNRDYFMTTADIESEIKALEGLSAELKSDKALSVLDYAGKIIGGSVYGGNTSPVRYDSSASDAEVENNARLKYLKELLATKPDFDAEKAYKEADGKNLWDVITTDYTYADYLNDKDSKNIYGNAVVSQKDEENLQKIINDNEKYTWTDSDGKPQTGSITALLDKYISVNRTLSGGGYGISSNKYSNELSSINKALTDAGYDFKSILESYERNKNKKATNDVAADISAFTKEHPVLGNIASVGTNLIGGFSALPSALKTGIQDAASDDIVTLDTNAPEWALKNATDSIRDTTSKMISENNEGLKGEFYNFLYQTGMSAADMGASFVAGGFNSTVYPLIMFSNAAADKIKTVTENGGSVDEALLSGLMAGAFEAIFEKIGIDKLVETVTSSAGKSVFKSFLNGFLSEGLEELGTDIANSMSDALINGNNSEFNNKIYAYMQDGHSAKEAKALALTDLAKQYMSSFAGGALTGGMISGVGGGINNAVYNSQIRDIGKSINESGNIQELINYAKESGYDADKVEKLYENSSVAKKLHEIAVAEAQEKATSDKNNNAEVDASIEETKNRLGIGQRIADRRSNYATGKLYADVQNNIIDTATANIRSAVMQKLTENGIDNDNAQKYTDLILKSANERLSASEIRVLNNNTLALNMAQELMNGTAEWYDNAVMPSQNSRAFVASLAQKRAENNETQTENENVSSEEPVIDEKTDSPQKIVDTEAESKRIYSEHATKTLDTLLSRTSEEHETVVRDLFDEYYTAGTLGSTTVNDVKQTVFDGNLDSKLIADIKQYALAEGMLDANSSESKNPSRVVKKGGVTNRERAVNEFNMNSDAVDFIDIIAKKLGVNVQFNPILEVSGFTPKGYYDNGTIYISAKFSKQAVTVFTHELCHHLQETAPEQYKNYKRFVIENIRKNPGRYSEILGNLKLTYRQVTPNMLDMSIMDEIAADSLELFFTDTDFVNEAIENDRTFVEKVLDGLKKFLAKIKEAINAFVSNERAGLLREIMKQQNNFQHGVDLVENMLRSGESTVENADLVNYESTKNTAQIDGDKTTSPKYLLVGKKAKTANYKRLDEAISLESEGLSLEEIRQQTGWFRGYDNKWRFEIDDSKMEFSRKGFFTNPDVLRYHELADKFLYGEISDEENRELQALKKSFEGVKLRPETLGDYVRHDELFAAYPELKNLKVTLRSDMPREVHGSYNSQNKEIILNSFWAHDEDAIRHTLIHEIQHVIQDIEGFAGGADTRNPDYDRIAGEVEARDVSKRLGYDAEKRKNTRPDVDRTDVAFVDDNVLAFCIRENEPNSFNIQGKTLDEQLHEALDTAVSKERRYVYVGKFTDDFINKLKDYIEIKNYPIVMNYRDAYLSMESKEKGRYQGMGINYHNLGLQGLKSALESFSSPECVILQENGSKIELILNGEDYKGRQLFSVVSVNTTAQNNQKFLSVHVVTSVYGHKGIQKRINKALNEGRVIYQKNEESTQGMPQVQYERDINANSSNDNISHSETIVNKHSMRSNDKNSNIRYLIDDEALKEVEVIGNIEGNAFDREVSDIAEDMTENLHKIVQGKELSKAAFQKTAGAFLKRYNSNMSRKDLADRLEALVEYIRQENPDTNGLQEACFSIAKQVIEKSDVRDDSLNIEYKDLRKDILKRKVYVNRLDMSTEDIRQAAALANRRFYITTDPNQRSEKVRDIDEFYDELHNNYPEFFPETSSPSEQFDNIAAFLDATSVRVRNMYDSGEMGMSSAEAARILGGELYHTIATAVNDLYGTKESIRVAALYYGAIEKFRKQRINQNARFIEYAKEKDTQVAQYRELAYRKIEEKKAELRAGAERRQVVDQLKKLYSSSIKLLNGSRTDKMGVPTDFKKAFVDVLELVNFANDRFPDSILNLKAKDIHDRLTYMRDRLEEMKKIEESSGNTLIDDEIIEYINSLRYITNNGNKTISEMTTDELKMLRSAIEHFKGLITNSNKMFSDELDRTRDEYGQAIISELLATDDKKSITYGTKLQSLHSTLAVNQMMPIYFFENIGGTLDKLYKNVMMTEEKQSDIVNDAVKTANKIMKKYHFDKWAFDTPAKEFYINGHKIQIELFEAMSLYAIAKREKGNAGSLTETSHLLNGGITLKPSEGKFFEKLKEKIKNKKDPLNRDSAQNIAIKVNADHIQKISDMLTDEQKQFADAMIEYLSKDLAAVGNEASRKMYNYDIFNEDYYFPMKVDDNYLASSIDKHQSKQAKNSSFTKHVALGSNAPVIISNFMDVWIEHVSGMSVYAASAPALNDFMRVYNYKDGANTVKGLLKECYGEDYDRYIMNLMEDLNGGYRTDFTGALSDSLIRNMKTAAVALSISSAIQQPSAIGRAYSYLGLSKTRTASKKGYDEMMKYSALARIKNKAGYDTMAGTSLMYEMMYGDTSVLEKSKLFFENLKHKETRSLSREQLEQAGFFLPSLMDQITWSAIWNTCKAQIRSQRKYKYESKEFFGAVTELFNDVIRHTQVYDSTFQRSGNLRSGHALVKMEMSFMSEPTIAYNMLMSTKNDIIKGNKKQAARKIGSVVLAMIFNTILKSVVTAFYKWDDEEPYYKNYFSDIFSNLMSDAGSMVPYVKDIISMFEGYDVERMDLTNISRLINAWNQLSSDKITPVEKFSNLAGYLADIFGVPGTTIKKNLYAIYNNFLAGGADAGIPYEEMIKAVKAGDSSKLSKMYEDLIIAGYKKSTITNGYRAAMAENIPEIFEAAEYLINGDESNYYSTCRELIDMGFAHDDIKAAVKLAMETEQEKQVSPIVDFYNLVFNKSKDEKIEVPDYVNPVFSEMVDSVIDGDSSSFTDMYNQLIADGYSESQINSGYREAMAEMLPEVADAAKFYKEGQMGSYSIALSEITKQGFNLSDAKAAVKKYLELDNVEMSEGEKFAASRISDIGNNINQGADVFVQEELFDGAVYDYDMMYYVLVEQGSNSVDYKTIEKYFLDNGKTKKSLTTAMENRAKKTVKRWINAVNVGDTTTYQKCLKELTTFYGSQSEAVSVVNKYRSEQESLIKKYLNSSGNKQSEAKEELISEYGDWSTAQKAIDYYQKH